MKQDAARRGLVVSPGVVIPPSELAVRATRAGGPGGQHVNTSSTRVELLWQLRTSTAVTEEQRARLASRLAARLDADGNVRVVASDTRSQRQNRALAEERLAAIVSRAMVVPKARRRTGPTRASVERRLDDKHHRAERKRQRQDPGDG